VPGHQELHFAEQIGLYHHELSAQQGRVLSFLEALKEEGGVLAFSPVPEAHAIRVTTLDAKPVLWMAHPDVVRISPDSPEAEAKAQTELRSRLAALLARSARSKPEANRSAVHAYVTIYSNYVSGVAEPRSQLTLILKDGRDREKGRAAMTTSWQGAFGAYLKDPRGQAVPVLGGDTLEILSAQGDKTIIPVVPLVARADWTSNRVFGQAPPGAIIEVNLVFIRAGVLTVLVSTPVVDENGYYEVDYTGRVEIAGGDHGSVAYRDANGNIIRLEYDVPLIRVQEHGNWVSGTLWHDVAVGVRLLSADGDVRTVVTITTSLRGDFSVSLRDRLGNAVLIQPGDRLEVHLPGVVLPVTVVPLTAHADPAADRVSGVGPPQSSLQVQLYQQGADWRSVSVNTDVDGKYLADFGAGVDIRNGDYGNVNYTDARGQVIWMRYTVPWIQIQVGGTSLRGLVAPGDLVSVTLLSSQGALRAEGFSISHPVAGNFLASLRSMWDRGVQVRPGDRVRVRSRGAGEIIVDVPLFTAEVDADLRYVSGNAPANASLQVVLYKAAGGAFQIEVEADSQGRYQANFGPRVTIEAGDAGYVYYTLPSGHQVSTYFNAPWIWLWLDDASIGGQAWPNARVTGLLLDASGQVIATGATQADLEGQFSLTTTVTCGMPGLPAPGNRLDLDFAEWHIQLGVPLLTASADASQDTVSGLAPPGGLVKVYLESRWASVQSAYASASGEYTVHLAGQVDLKASDYGYVVYVAPGGHEIRRRFVIPWVQLQMGVDHFEGRMPPGAQFLATLYGPSGTEKGFGRGQASARGSFGVNLQDVEGQPVHIEGGDRLQLSVSGDVVLAVEVPALSVHMTVGSNVVTGTGPALQPVEVRLYRNSGWADIQTVNTDISGQYAVEFEGSAFAPGDYVLVYATDADGHRTFDRTNTLWMSLEIGNNQVSGRAEPGSGLTVVVRGEGGVGRATATTTASRGSGDFSVALYDADGQPLLISANDLVEITADDGSRIQTEVPRLTLMPDPETDRVTGLAPAGSIVKATLSSAMRASYYQGGAIADESGHYAVSLRPFGNIRYGDSVSLAYTSPEGFLIWRQYALPWLSVELDTNHVAGRVPYSATVAIELLNPSGEERANVEVPTSSTGSFEAYLFDSTGSPAIVQTGDMVRMLVEGVGPVQLVVPELTANVDLPTAAVGGRAAPGSPVRVELRSGNCTYTQEVLANDDGAFLASFSYIAGLTIGDYGLVYWNSADGNSLFTRYEVPTHHIFVPLLAK